MTSLYGPTSLYTIQEPTIFVEKHYEPSNMMYFIRKHSPLFAQCIQKAGLEDWFNSDECNATCFIPCKEYSNLHLNTFIDNMSIQTARKVVLASTLRNRVLSDTLAQSEYIPALDNVQYIHITKDYCNRLVLNNTITIIEKDILLDNGVIHITNGLLSPSAS